MESLDADHPSLEHEWRVYKALRGGSGITHALWFGCERGYNALILKLHGPSLEELFNKCHRRFSLKTVLILAEQLVSLHCHVFKDPGASNYLVSSVTQISQIEYIHEHDYLHRDIKPDNFVVDIHQSSHIFIINFGLAGKYRNDATRLHIPYRTGKALTGTTRYASINAHCGIEQTRRDDLESLAYVLIYFLRGALPWQNFDAPSKKSNYHRILQQKQETSPAELCSGLPNEFQRLLEYARNLPFGGQPDYNYLRQLFRCRLEADGHYEPEDRTFDWQGFKGDAEGLPLHTGYPIRGG
jgi:casein kinase I homolog HRR25